MYAKNFDASCVMFLRLSSRIGRGTLWHAGAEPAGRDPPAPFPRTRARRASDHPRARLRRSVTRLGGEPDARVDRQFLGARRGATTGPSRARARGAALAALDSLWRRRHVDRRGAARSPRTDT